MPWFAADRGRSSVNGKAVELGGEDEREVIHFYASTGQLGRFFIIG